MFLQRHGIAREFSADAGVAWSVLAVPMLLLVHDTWFYWMHRALHTKALFRRFHKQHHLSIDPSPLTSFAFHPAEAVAESFFIILVFLVVPLPRASMIIFQLIAFGVNIYGHLGIELLPRSFAASPLFQLLNTTTHHHQHHRCANANFGLYFNVWDRILGTNHPDYETAFVTRSFNSTFKRDTTVTRGP
ncbi:MAG: sterol desaturase family protein [Clostridia bacterium]|nr:sterol desaturase family protein [Deltaproteobacteria bacterium]